MGRNERVEGSNCHTVFAASNSAIFTVWSVIILPSVTVSALLVIVTVSV